MAMTDPHAILRTSRVMYALFCSILGLVFLLGAFVAIAKEPAFWLPTAIMGGVLVAFVSWMATTSLTLAKDNIHYRSLFIATDVLLSEIVQAISSSELAVSSRTNDLFSRFAELMGTGRSQLTSDCSTEQRLGDGWPP
jgi:hypothetical protein